MLSIEECRDILLANQEKDLKPIDYSKEDIITLREILGNLVQIEFEYYQNMKDEKTCNSLP